MLRADSLARRQEELPAAPLEEEAEEGVGAGLITCRLGTSWGGEDETEELESD